MRFGYFLAAGDDQARKKLTIIGLEDSTNKLDIVVFSEVYEAQQTHAQVGEMLIVEGEIAPDEYSGGIKMTASQLYSVDEARTRFAKCITIDLSKKEEGFIPALQSILKANTGECVVQVRYSGDAAKATLNLGKQWRVVPSDQLLMTLEELLGEESVGLSY